MCISVGRSGVCRFEGGWYLLMVRSWVLEMAVYGDVHLDGKMCDDSCGSGWYHAHVERSVWGM